MIKTIKQRTLNTKLIATLLFIVISAMYILIKFGLEQLLDTLFLWMFPASIMIFLTLVMVRILEKVYKKSTRPPRTHKYINIKTK